MLRKFRIWYWYLPYEVRRALGFIRDFLWAAVIGIILGWLAAQGV